MDSIFCPEIVVLTQSIRQMGPHDGPDPRHVLLLAAAHDKLVCRRPQLKKRLLRFLRASRMPPVTRVQPKKQALAGVMRIVPEGTPGAWSVFPPAISSARLIILKAR